MGGLSKMKARIWNQRTKGILKWLLSCMVFLVIVLYSLTGMGRIMQNKSGRENVTPLYLPNEQYDVVLLGTSHVVSSLFPMVMWESEGVTACNFAQTGQVFPLTYYAAEEAIRVAAPRLLVCDLYYAYIASQYAGNTAYKHQTLDNMSMKSLPRLRAIMNAIPDKEKMNFLLPFFAYHSRWSSLEKKDFVPAASYSKGSGEIFTRMEETFDAPFVPIDRSDVLMPDEHIVHYIDRMIALCRDTGTELLFVVVPYYAMSEQQGRQLEDDQRMFNWIANYVSQQGIGCLNMLYCLDEMGFDMNQHMREWNHQNYWGGEVTSRYLAQYIRRNYGIEDHRGETGYEHWDEDMKRYQRWRQSRLDAQNQ